MSKVKVIVNPTSGRGNGERSIPRIQQLMGEDGITIDLVRTERPWHAVELARQAVVDGFEIVVAAGGDGTANEVLNGLMQAKQAGLGQAAMSILCVGRGNDFAYGMGLPVDLEAGCRAIAAGRRRWIDVGKVEGGLFPQGRYFGNGVGVGFDAVVGFVALKIKWLTGFPSYIVAALETIFLYFHAPTVTIELDSETLELPALMVSVMNGKRMGGGFMMAPEALIDDGLFNLCIAEQVSRARIFTIIPHFLKGTQATQKPIRMRQSRHVTVTAVKGDLPAHADGETLCEDGKRLVLELLPKQIEFITVLPETQR